MSKPIEDYGLIGNTLTAALVARDGSMDWLCVPHFDSDACFAALLGTEEHGHWQLAPVQPVTGVSRRYVSGTCILETRFETDAGVVTLVDFMPFTDDEHRVQVVRLVRGEAGRVSLRMRLAIRFGHGQVVPWVRRHDDGSLHAVAGPDALELHAPVDLHGENFVTVGDFDVGPGDVVPFTLAWRPSHWPGRELPLDWQRLLDDTTRRWREWSSRCHHPEGAMPAWREAVERSAITLKALTFAPTGGIVAAPTTSLPEHLGGVRNWDYRYCWIRDSTLTLYALMHTGYRDEAQAWREWLLRAAAGDPRQLQIMYGLRGERRLVELELPWLPGYEGSRPVRIGNAAHGQRQLDVPGELMDVLHAGRKFNLDGSEPAWRLQKTILRRLEQDWDQPDEGIWEVRGGAQHFTHSRVMCWVAFDRAVRAVEVFGLDGPVDRWREMRARIHADVCRHGWHDERKSFVQSYDSTALDASQLLMAEVGFLAPDDPRFAATVAAIERELLQDGLVLRYRTEQTRDGLPTGEGVFLACSFWLADAYLLLGRRDDAAALFERLLALRNDLGLLAEEYDPASRRQLGNFPQAFSHIALINTAISLASRHGAAEERAGA